MPNSLSTEFENIHDYPHAMIKLLAIREQSFKANVYPDENGVLAYWEHVVAWLDEEHGKHRSLRTVPDSLLREMRKYANESLEVVRKRYVERMAKRVISGDNHE